MDRTNGSIAREYVLYSALTGAAYGFVYQFGEVIAYKGLGVGTLAVTLLTMTGPLANFASLWWARLLVGRDQRPHLKVASVFALGALASGLLLGSWFHLLAVYLLYYVVLSLAYTAENRVLQQHVPAARTGRLFGGAGALKTAVIAIVAATAGFYMDAVPGGYRHLFGAAAVFACVGIWRLALVPTGRNGTGDPEPLGASLILGPLKQAVPLLRARKDFLRFEAAFMIYGVAFMMLLPVVPLYLVEDLTFSYGTIGLARGTVDQLCMALSIPLLGRLFDRSTPHRMCAAMFLLLGFYPLLLIAAGHLEGPARLACAFSGSAVYGVAMGGVIVLWSLSTIRFAGGEDVGIYHSVHIAATGIRGLFAPFLGYCIMSAWGKEAALAVAACLWALSSVAMVVVRLWDMKVRPFHTLRAVPRAATRPPGST